MAKVQLIFLESRGCNNGSNSDEGSAAADRDAVWAMFGSC